MNKHLVNPKDLKADRIPEGWPVEERSLDQYETKDEMASEDRVRPKTIPDKEASWSPSDDDAPTLLEETTVVGHVPLRIKPKDFNKGLEVPEKGITEEIPSHGFQPIRNTFRARNLNKSRATTAGDIRRRDRENEQTDGGASQEPEPALAVDTKTTADATVKTEKAVNEVNKTLKDTRKDKQAERKENRESDKEEGEIKTDRQGNEKFDRHGNPKRKRKSDGGALYGASHANGGMDINAEGGEYIIRATSAASLGTARLDYMNRTGTLPEFKKGRQLRR